MAISGRGLNSANDILGDGGSKSQQLAATKRDWIRCLRWPILSRLTFVFLLAVAFLFSLFLIHVITIPMQMKMRWEVYEATRIKPTQDLVAQQFFPLRTLSTRPLPLPILTATTPAADSSKLDSPIQDQAQPVGSDVDPNIRDKLSPQAAQISENTTPDVESHPFYHPNKGFDGLPIPVTPVDEAFNPSMVPLPPNPNNYKYFMTKRISLPRPPQWNGFPTSSHYHYGVHTCYSDWFPTQLIEKLEREENEETGTNSISGHDELARAARIPYEEGWHLSDDQIQQGLDLHGYLNMSRVDLNELASYYGYKTYDEMPYHTRIPVSKRDPGQVADTRVEWQHLCITKPKIDYEWTQDQDPQWYKPFDKLRGFWYTGSEDGRLFYDRCGRLLYVFGKYNDQTPISPTWAQFVLDARRFDEELLFKPFELCEVMYQERILTHRVRNDYDGHVVPTIEKNHHEIPYGFDLADITALVSLRNTFKKSAKYFDHKTNSYYLTQDAYNRIVTQLNTPIPSASIPYTSEIHTHSSNIVSYGGAQAPPQWYQHPLKQWLDGDPAYLRYIQPYGIAHGSMFWREQPQSFFEREDWKFVKYVNEQKPRSGGQQPHHLYIPSRDEDVPEPSDPVPPPAIPPSPFTTHYPTRIPTGLNPKQYHVDAARSGDRINANDESKPSLPQCLTKYLNVRIGDTGIGWRSASIHSAPSLLLIHISDEEWGFSPSPHGHVDGDSFPTSQPPPHQDTHPNWVYVTVHHDNSHHLHYRPIIAFYNAITMDLMAIHHVAWSAHNKCARSDCVGGVGPGCGICAILYTHHLVAVSTPLSFSILKGEDNAKADKDGDINFKDQRQSLHTPLPNFHTLDSQFFAAVNEDDRIAWMQELDLKSVWYNRFSCEAVPIESLDPPFIDIPVPPTRDNYSPPQTVNDWVSQSQKKSKDGKAWKTAAVDADVEAGKAMGGDNKDHNPDQIYSGNVETPEPNTIIATGTKFLDAETHSLLSHREQRKAHVANPAQDRVSPQSKTIWRRTDMAEPGYLSIKIPPYSPPRRLFAFASPGTFEFYDTATHIQLLRLCVAPTLLLIGLIILVWKWVTFSSWAKPTRKLPPKLNLYNVNTEGVMHPTLVNDLSRSEKSMIHLIQPPSPSSSSELLDNDDDGY